MKMIADTYCGNSTQIGRTVFHVFLMSETHAHARTHAHIHTQTHTHARTHAQLCKSSISYIALDFVILRGIFSLSSTIQNRYLLTRQILRCTRNYCAACNRTRRTSILSGYNKDPPHGCPHYITSIILSLCCNAPVTAVKV